MESVLLEQETRLRVTRDDRVEHSYPTVDVHGLRVILSGTLSYCGLHRIEGDWISVETPPKNACDACVEYESRRL